MTSPPSPWVLVPREPTEEMRKAGRAAIPAGHGQAWIYACDVYDAMLEAAPPPPAGQLDLEEVRYLAGEARNEAKRFAKHYAGSSKRTGDLFDRLASVLQRIAGGE